MKQFTAKMLLMFVSLIVCFAMCELALRVVHPLSNGVGVSEVMPKRTYAQDIPGLRSEIEIGTNRFGMRSLSLKTKRKGDDVIRILCIGASTTIQWSHQLEETWSGVLEGMLNERYAKSGKRFEVAAYAKGGETVWDGYRYALSKIPDFDPDFVINLWGVNTLAWLGGPAYAYQGIEENVRKAHQEEVIREARGDSAVEAWLRQHSQVFRHIMVVKMKLQHLMAVQKGKVFSYESANLPNLRKYRMTLPYVENPKRDKGDPLPEFKDGLSMLLKELRSQSRIAIVMGQPTLWKDLQPAHEDMALWFYVNADDGRVRPSTGWLANEIKRYNAVQKELASDFDFSYVALPDIIPKSLHYFWDDCHLTIQANTLTAEAIYEAIRADVDSLLQ